MSLRVGQGWDLHRLVEGRALMVGGVRIPHDKGEAGHSDGDVLLHAVTDAVLGAAGLGDIGTHFPPTDECWKNAISRSLLRSAMELVRRAGWECLNLDCTLVLERPRMWPHRDEVISSIADCLGIDRSAVSFKAKTAEGLGEVGSGDAIEAMAVCLLKRRD